MYVVVEPRKQNVTRGIFKMIDGQWHKRCTGPAHEEMTYLPATEKYFYANKGKRKGTIHSVCRLCSAVSKLGLDSGLDHGYVDAGDVRGFYIEAVNRIGMKELAKRSGVNRFTIANVVRGKTRKVQKAKLKLIMLELISAQRKGEFSASRQAQWQNNRRAAGPEAKFCVGCGRPIWNSDGLIDEYTDGCNACTERRIGKDKRLRAKGLTEAV